MNIEDEFFMADVWCDNCNKKDLVDLQDKFYTEIRRYVSGDFEECFDIECPDCNAENHIQVTYNNSDGIYVTEKCISVKPENCKNHDFEIKPDSIIRGGYECKKCGMLKYNKEEK